MASDWEWRSKERYRSIVQKLEELEGVLRAYAATKGITSVPAQGMGQIQPCDRVEDRTLFLEIHLEEYLISWEVLDQVFSSVGTIEVIEIFDNDPHYHSRIRFRDRDSVLKAFDSLNGRCIYDDCCRMELFVDGRARSGRLNQVEAPIKDAGQFEGHQAPINSQIQSVKRQIARISDLGVSSVAGEEAIGIPGGYSVNCNHELSDSHEAKNPFEAKIERQELTQIKIENDPKESTKENSNGFNLERSSWKKGSEMFARQLVDQKIINVHQNMGDFVGKLSLSFKQTRVASESIIDSCEVVSDSFELVISNVTYEESVESGLGIPSAHQVFEELSLRGLNICDASILQGNMLMGKSNQVFYPGDTKILKFVALEDNLGIWSFDLSPFLIVDNLGSKQPLVNDQNLFENLSKKKTDFAGLYYPYLTMKTGDTIFIFDPGGVFALYATGLELNSSGFEVSMEVRVPKQRLQCDPGGLYNLAIQASFSTRNYSKGFCAESLVLQLLSSSYWYIDSGEVA